MNPEELRDFLVERILTAEKESTAKGYLFILNCEVARKKASDLGS
jgi:hypothetical protein